MQCWKQYQKIKPNRNAASNHICKQNCTIQISKYNPAVPQCFLCCIHFLKINRYQTVKLRERLSDTLYFKTGFVGTHSSAAPAKHSSKTSNSLPPTYAQFKIHNTHCSAGSKLIATTTTTSKSWIRKSAGETSVRACLTSYHKSEEVGHIVSLGIGSKWTELVFYSKKQMSCNK